MYKKLLALSTFSGTIIGVGLFGLPYVTAQIGFIPMIFYFLFLGIVMLFIQLMYGEISLRTTALHRLPGYSRIYLNRSAEAITYTTTIVGLTGSLLAYIVIGGEFLTSLLMPILGGNNFIYSAIFFIAGSLLIYFGSGPVSKTEFFSLGLFFIILIILFLKASSAIDWQYLTTVNVDLKNFFLPYGVILFSISGMAIIPELKEILHDDEKSIKNIIITGLIIPIVTYLIFIITIYGVTGSNTTPEGMTGLNLALGGGIAAIGFVFGIITTFTSFLTLGITLKKEFHYDWGLPGWLSWIAACVPAFALYMAGFKNFIGIIGFIGSVTLGIDITIISLIYLKSKTAGQRVPAYSMKISKKFVTVLTTLFIIGVIFEISKIIFSINLI